MRFWFARPPWSRLLLVVVVLVLLVVLAGRFAAGGVVPHPAPASVSTPLTPSMAASAGATPSPQGTPSLADVSAAQAAAGGFLKAWASYRYDDSPATQAANVQLYVTDRLYQSFAESNGNGMAIVGREVGTATVARLDFEGASNDGRLAFAAQVQVAVKSDSASSTRKQPVEVICARTAKGWRVDEVNP